MVAKSQDSVCGQDFKIAGDDLFRIRNLSGVCLRQFIAGLHDFCHLGWPGELAKNFDQDFPRREFPIDPHLRGG